MRQMGDRECDWRGPVVVASQYQLGCGCNWFPREIESCRSVLSFIRLGSVRFETNLSSISRLSGEGKGGGKGELGGLESHVFVHANMLGCIIEC